MSGFGEFSHIYHGEPADPLPLPTPLLFGLLSQVFPRISKATLALTQTATD